MSLYRIICVSVITGFMLTGCQPVVVTREHIKVAEVIVRKHYEPRKKELEMCVRGIPCNRYRTIPRKWYVTVTGSVDGKACSEVVIDPMVNLCIPMKRYVTKEEAGRLLVGNTLRTIYF